MTTIEEFDKLASDFLNWFINATEEERAEYCERMLKCGLSAKEGLSNLNKALSQFGR